MINIEHIPFIRNQGFSYVLFIAPSSLRDYLNEMSEKLTIAFVFFLVMLALSSKTHAQIFTCKVDGVTVFKDSPCKTSETPVDFDSESIVGRPPIHSFEGENLACTLERLKRTMKLKLRKDELFYGFCGQAVPVTKKELLAILTDGKISQNEKIPNNQIIDGTTNAGHLIRLQWNVKDNTFESGILLSEKLSESTDINEETLKPDIDRINPQEQYEREKDKLHQSIKVSCQSKWPTNYRQQEYCISTQTEAMREVARLITTNKGYPQKTGIIGRCMTKWSTSNFSTSNYRQIVYCVTTQIESFDRLQ